MIVISFCESVVIAWSKHSLVSQFMDLVINIINIQKYGLNKEKLPQLDSMPGQSAKHEKAACILGLHGHVTDIIRVWRVLVYYSWLGHLHTLH